MHIDIANNQNLLEIDEEFLREAARETLRAEQVSAAEISIALVDDPAIHALNRRHLGHDYPTDVLSFLFDCSVSRVESRESRDESQTGGGAAPLRPSTLDPRLSTLTTLDPPPRGRGKTIDGEIVVSVETALRKAAECKWNPNAEIVLYLVHGLLHLAGYDDLCDNERELMRSRERAILGLWNLSPTVDS